MSTHVAGTLRITRLEVKGVIANGGCQAQQRAALAKAQLKLLGMHSEIPVGVGTAGQKYEVKPHEYSLLGYKECLQEHIEAGHPLFIRSVLEASS